MHDSFLMQNIIKNLKDICKDNNFVRIKSVQITVNWDSHITQQDLREHLMELCDEYINKDTIVGVVFGDVPELTANIDYIEGEEG
ncbi:hypothetical protein [Clostridium tunisiense]|uniref:hypothetical protein n=1 Tax=Clostridium tunisiense TaxID=219748 RepID=UPI0002EBAF83|nr:hypothetical protein [Clostridium tunisiense]